MIYFKFTVLFVVVTRSAQQSKHDSSLKLFSEPPMAKCQLPAAPKNGSFVLPICQTNSTLPDCKSSEVPSYWLLEFSCQPGFFLPRNVDVYYSRCFDGSWVPVPPVCLNQRVVHYISKTSTPKSTSKPIPGGCLLPKYPVNGRYFTFSCNTGTVSDPGCNNIPGTPVPSSWTITYTCDPGFEKQFSGDGSSPYARCTNGSWDTTPPMCIKTCPALVSPTHKYRCFYGREEVDCSKAMEPGTVATYHCREFWSRDPHDPAKLLSCTADGKWTYNPPPCEPTCGISTIDSNHPRVIDGDPSPLGHFPWHTGVYRRAENGKGWDQFCGGALIKPNVVVTAAFCVVKEREDRTLEIMLPKDIRVALGKYYRDWNKVEDTEVKRMVTEVKVASDYRGSSTNFESDIALLLLNEEVPLSKYVMTVCLKSPTPPLENNMLGYITGWGNSEMLEPSSTVLYCSWPFQNYKTCFQNMVQKKDSYISADKFCAGVEVRAAARKSVGGSFSFVIKNKHYIYGILSSQVLRSKPIDYFNEFNYPAFTNITHPTHLQWITSTTEQWAAANQQTLDTISSLKFP